MLEITTEHGTKYLIDHEYSLWCRVPVGNQSARYWNKIWSLSFSPTAALPPYDPEADGWVDTPTVGHYMFISGKDLWWLSTKIVSIEET